MSTGFEKKFEKLEKIYVLTVSRATPRHGEAAYLFFLDSPAAMSVRFFLFYCLSQFGVKPSCACTMYGARGTGKSFWLICSPRRRQGTDTGVARQGVKRWRFFVWKNTTRTLTGTRRNGLSAIKGEWQRCQAVYSVLLPCANGALPIFGGERGVRGDWVGS